MHFDQNWGQYIMVFFNHDEYYTIRDYCYNIAYWNLHYTGKHLELKNNNVYVGDRKAVFLHFSGTSLFEHYDLKTISRHQSRYTIADFPNLEPILKAYIKHIEKFHVGQFRKVPYGFHSFSDGSPVPTIIKSYYTELVDVPGALLPYQFSIPTSARPHFFDHEIVDPFEMDPGKTKNNYTFVEWLLSGPHNFIVDLEGNEILL